MRFRSESRIEWTTDPEGKPVFGVVVSSKQLPRAGAKYISISEEGLTLFHTYTGSGILPVNTDLARIREGYSGLD
jgi:hypothetical protein